MGKHHSKCEIFCRIQCFGWLLNYWKQSVDGDDLLTKWLFSNTGCA